MPGIDGPAARGRVGTGPRLVVDVSAHGYGHAGQLAPVLAALRARRPGLELVLRTALPEEALRRLLGGWSVRAAPPPDIGLLMRSPVEPDRPATRAWYDRLEAGWEATIAGEAEALRALRPDLLLANVGPVGLAAATAAGIPALALSSLDWADILEAYGLASAGLIGRLREAYAAVPFVQVAPHMPMAWHPDRRPVGPVARSGRSRRPELAAALGLGSGRLVALVAFGGIPTAGPPVTLPPLDGVTWLADRLTAPGLVPVGGLDWPFPDLLASVDLLVTKTGYGLLVEAAVAGTPVLYLARPDWPEAPHLERWIEERGIGRPLPTDPRAIEEAVRAVAAAPRPRPVEPTGVGEALAILERHL